MQINVRSNREAEQKKKMRLGRAQAANEAKERRAAKRSERVSRKDDAVEEHVAEHHDSEVASGVELEQSAQTEQAQQTEQVANDNVETVDPFAGDVETVDGVEHGAELQAGEFDADGIHQHEEDTARVPSLKDAASKREMFSIEAPTVEDDGEAGKAVNAIDSTASQGHADDPRVHNARKQGKSTRKSGNKRGEMKSRKTRTKGKEHKELLDELEDDEGYDGNPVVSDVLTVGYALVASALIVLCGVMGFVISDAARVILLSMGG